MRESTAGAGPGALTVALTGARAGARTEAGTYWQPSAAIPLKAEVAKRRQDDTALVKGTSIHLLSGGPVLRHIPQQASGNGRNIEGCGSSEHEQGGPPQQVVHPHRDLENLNSPERIAKLRNELLQNISRSALLSFLVRLESTHHSGSHKLLSSKFELLQTYCKVWSDPGQPITQGVIRADC